MTAKPPKIDDAPGLTWKPRKNAWEARWQADGDLVKRGYETKSARIWAGPVSALNAAAIGFIQQRCRTLQTEMRVWGRGGTPIEGDFDGTLRSLIICYQTQKFSRYHKIRHQTRNTYDNLCRRIAREIGLVRIDVIDSSMIMEWHEGWSSGGRVALAHSMIAMLRSLFSFGSTLLKNPEGKAASKILSGELSELRFAMPKARTVELTPEQVDVVRAKARAMGFPSVALANAFQCEGTLRQKDCIGEWVPLSEPVPSDVIDGNKKCIRGLRWNEIDENLILRHVTSKVQKEVVIDLKLASMVMEELRLTYGQNFTRADLPSSGPIIVNEGTGIPYSTMRFRRRWREVADACGIPKNVRNMDTRAGAIREGLRSGASLDAVRKTATHSNSNMTQRYSRGDADDIAEVMTRRAALRNKTGTKEP